MLLAHRVAGNSGMLKSLVVGPRELDKAGYIVGLVLSGIIMAGALPAAFDSPTDSNLATIDPDLATLLLGTVLGVGVLLGNGCTSGHGLCGLSRLSYRSLVAVPTFMITAVLTSTSFDGFVVGPPAPLASTELSTVRVVVAAALVLAALLMILLLVRWKAPSSSRLLKAAVGAWCGLCSGAGLTVGGMVRPSSVRAALSPRRLDLGLWLLFASALATTFVLYRLAEHRGVCEARAAAGAQGRIDARLVAGAVLFGCGWGATGACPGPLIVMVSAAPTAMGPLLLLLGVALGMQLAAQATAYLEHRRLGSAKTTPKGPPAPCSETSTAFPPGRPPPSPLLTPPLSPPSPPPADADGFASAAELSSALDDGAIHIDVRTFGSSEALGGVLRTLSGALWLPWDAAAGTLPLAAIPTAIKETPLIVTCRSGKRAAKASAALRDAGYSRVLNGGGPAGPPELWAVLAERRGELAYPMHGLQITQLFDGPGPAGGSSCTLSYLLFDEATKEAVIIDPVLEQVDRDLAAINELGGRLVLAINTHCHADHVTGTGELKRRVPGLRSAIAEASGARADVLLRHGDILRWAGGARALCVLATPGHTEGCISLHEEDVGAVFTGDALLIGGCGRTDFQGGSAATLYKSVHLQLFSLPPKTLVLPAHDYKGRRASTIGAEARSNPRLNQTEEAFVNLMSTLDLPRPAKLDSAVPLNLLCGVQA